MPWMNYNSTIDSKMATNPKHAYVTVCIESRYHEEVDLTKTCTVTLDRQLSTRSNGIGTLIEGQWHNKTIGSTGYT